MIDTGYNINPNIAKASKTLQSDEKQLKEACQGFEALFVHKMLQVMRSATDTMDSGLVKKSNGEKIFTDMLDQKYAELSSEQSVNGIADLMFEQLKGTLNNVNEKDLKSRDKLATAQNEIQKSAMHSSVMSEMNRL